MQRRRVAQARALFLATATALAIATLACDQSDGGAAENAAENAAGAKRRNVVLIALDTLRPDRLGLYGCERGTSPSLDAFAREAFVFDNAQTVSPWTAPSLVTAMTGLHPEVHGVLDAPVPSRLNAAIVTLADVLRERGYDTAAFTEGGYAKPDFGLDQGFDLYPSHPDDQAGRYDVVERESRIAANVDRTIEWLAKREERPFFLFFHTYEAHSPYRASEELVRAFEPGYDETAELVLANAAIARWNAAREIDLDGALAIALARLRGPRGFAAIDGGAELVRRCKALDLGPRRIAWHPAVVARVKNLYDAGVRSLDRELARLLDALRARGDRDTAIVVFSDHGEGLGEHGELEHGETLHESVLRIAFLLRAPWLEAAPRRVDDVVRILDVAPTVLDLLEIDARALRMQGTSLVPLVSGGELDLTVLQHGRTMDHALDHLFSVRDARWRLVADLESGQRSLYDVRSDPSEREELSASHPTVVSELEAELLRWRAANATLARALPTAVERRAIDPATRRDLHALGYTGED